MRIFFKIITTMRKISFIAALVVAMIAVSCVKDLREDNAENGMLPDIPTEEVVTFKAAFGAVSKAVLEAGEEESKVKWDEGDQVSVLVGENVYLYKAENSDYTTNLLPEEKGVPANGVYYAVYPYDAEAIITGDVITTSLPSSQKAVQDSFSAHLSVSKADEENCFAFRNVCGLVRVKVAIDNVTKIEFKGNNDEDVAGCINVTVSDNPTWVAVEGATKTLELVPGESGVIERGYYYFAVLPQTFEKGITVTAYRGDEPWDVRKTTSSLTIRRSDMRKSNAFGVEGSGTEADPYLLDSSLDLLEMRSLAQLGDETWFKMVKDIDMEGVTNYAPVNYDQNFERKIHFDGGGFTISNLDLDKRRDGGNYTSLFGVLYGSCKNLKITNAKIKSTNACGVIGGYVGTTGKPAEVENVEVTNSIVTGEGDRAGGIAGQTVGSTFKNVSFQGEVISNIDKSANGDSGYTAASANAGGFAGLATGTSSFAECSTDVTISGKDSDVAGFIGQAQGTATFTDCSTKAIVNSSQEQKYRTAAFVGWSNGIAKYTRCKVLSGSSVNDISGLTNNRLTLAGGFMGYAGGTSVTADGCIVDVVVNLPYGQTVGGFVGNVGTGAFKATNCSVAGQVKGANQVGGFVGYQEAAASLEIASSYSTATITGTGHYTAGFAGYLVNASDKLVKLTDCYATGNVTSTGGSSCSGFLGRVERGVEVTRCYARCDLKANNNLGGVIGYIQNGPAAVSECYFEGNITGGSNVGGLTGSAYTAVTELTIEKCYTKGSISTTSSHVGGIIASPQAKSQSITDSWSSMDLTINSGDKLVNVGGIAGSVTSFLTMKRCYATGTISNTNATNNYGHVGGLIGRVTNGATLEECYFVGTAKGHYYVGGLLGALEGGTLQISKSYATGVVTGTGATSGRYHGGLVGWLKSDAATTTISNCWTSNNISGEQFIGGIIGASESIINVSNCFSSGILKARGVGGMVGRIQNTATVTKCLAWNTINSTRTGATQYASGAITGSVTKAGNFSACYRASDMSYYDSFVPTPADHEDIANALPPAPVVGKVDDNQYAYHGKPVAAGMTISAQAKTLGWDETIWNLSGTVPVLKFNINQSSGSLPGMGGNDVYDELF